MDNDQLIPGQPQPPADQSDDQYRPNEPRMDPVASPQPTDSVPPSQPPEPSNNQNWPPTQQPPADQPAPLPSHGVNIQPPQPWQEPPQPAPQPEPQPEPETPAPGSEEAIAMARAKIASLNDVYSQQQWPADQQPPQTEPQQPSEPQPPQPPVPPSQPEPPTPMPEVMPQPQPEPETPAPTPVENAFNEQLHEALERNQNLADTSTQYQPPPEPAPTLTSPSGPGHQQFGTFELPAAPAPVPQPEPQPPIPQPEPQTETPTPQPPAASAVYPQQPVTPADAPALQPTPQPPQVTDLGSSVKPTDVARRWRSYVAGKVTNYADLKQKVPHRLRHVLVATAIGFGIFLTFNSQIILGQVEYLTNSGEGEEVPLITEPTIGIQVSAESRVIIPKINVNVPVVYDEPSFDERKVQQALERGVVHYGNTSVPGEPGNNVIVGHSSNNWWASGKYKFAFVLLDKLEVGDTFALNFKGTQYVYEVFTKKIVAPDDLSVIKQTKEPITTLITCTPPGTSWKRLIVQAKQISPDPDLAVDTARDVRLDQIESPLPGNPPSLWDKVRDWLFGSGYIGLPR